MKKNYFLLSIGVLFLGFGLNAQESEIEAEEEDFSQYADLEMMDGGKRFTTSKVLDLSPNKLISFGYDFQGAHKLTLATNTLIGGAVNVNSVQGVRFASNFPVISKTNILVNVGINYWQSYYSIDGADLNGLSQTLEQNNLSTTGLNATVFKPLNEVNFLLFQVGADVNGDYQFPDSEALSETRLSGTAIYGWKKHDRLMYGFGVSRTYRVGELNYIPVFMYNYTFPSRKWGIESVFPSRFALRRTFNPRTLAFFGYELEGQTYSINNSPSSPIRTNLLRSEMRIRFTFEKSLKEFIWLSAQVGFRYDWSFNMDTSNNFRGFFGDEPYYQENNLSNALYFNLSLNLVSP
jgi:hypothetical protein